MQQRLEEIRSLQQKDKTLAEISAILKINPRTVEYYSTKIYREDREKIEKDSLAGRANIIKSYYEKGTKMCEAIMDDEKKSPKDRIDAFKTLVACQNNIYNMLKESPLRLKVIDTKPSNNTKELEDSR